MTRNPLIYVDYIISAMEDINRYIGDSDAATFFDESMAYDAVIRKLEVMTDATKNLPQSWKDRYQHINWKGMTAFRNILAHGYVDAIEDEVVWSIIKDHIPPLKLVMLEILEEHNKRA